MTRTQATRSRAAAALRRTAAVFGRAAVMLSMAMAIAACPEQTATGADGGSVLRDASVIPVYDAGLAEDAGALDAGLVDAGMDDAGMGDAGEPMDAGSAPDVFVDAVTPPTGVTNGGYRVRVAGYGFSPDSRVFFGDEEATQVLYLNERALTCRVPAAMSPGPITVRVESTLGTAETEAGFVYFSPVSLDSVSPAEGAARGGTAITLEGAGFTADMQVMIGGRLVSGLVLESPTRATGVAPAGAEGRTDVVAVDPYGRSTLELGFTFVAAPRLARVSPAAVAATETTVVDVWGTGLADATAVRIGGQDMPFVAVSAARLSVTVRGLMPGTHDVQVEGPRGTATLPGALLALADDAALSVAPATLPRTGGGTLSVVGPNLAACTAITVGGHTTVAADFARVAPSAAGDVVDVVLPATDTLGPVDVTAVCAAGDQNAPGALTYVRRARLDAALPTAGAPGDTVVLSGADLANITSVTVGGVDAVITAHAEDSVSITVPTGAGEVDIVAGGPDGTARLPGFAYESPLAVRGIQPVRGGMAGGTFVTVYGAGFASRTDLAFDLGGTPLVDVQVLSDAVATGRTQMASPGLVPLRARAAVGTPDEASAERAASYTYFDPTSIVGGARGGAVEGAVNVTAIDSFSGLPIEGMIAFLGTNGPGRKVGLTNLFGQVVLSGPDVQGSQTVTVMKDGYQSATMVDTNAADVTFFMSPLSLSGGGGGTPPPAPPPATINGRVFGFAKDLFDPAALGTDEVAVAVVTTTTRSEFSRNPNPGGQNVVFQEGGAYTIENARAGRVAVVALAGILNVTTGSFRVRQLGMRRAVYPANGVDLIDQDVELTVRLDETVTLSVPDAPIADLGPASVVRVVPFLRLGGEGNFNYTYDLAASRTVLMDAMPDLPGEMFTFIVGAYSTDQGGLITRTGTVTMRAGDAQVDGTGTNFAVENGAGQPRARGAVFYAESPEGETFGAIVEAVVGPGVLLLDRPAPFDVTGGTFHIGTPSWPQSQVRQDGVGPLASGVTIQPMLGLPEPVSPVQGGVMIDRTLRWKAAGGEQPTIHLMNLFSVQGGTWAFFLEGTRSKLVVPTLPPEAAALDVQVLPADLPSGGVTWQHQAMYVTGFDFANWSYIDIGSVNRRAWTTDIHRFINP